MPAPARQLATALVDGRPLVLVAPVGGGPVTDDGGAPVGPLLAVDVDPQLVAGPLGTPWDLAAVVKRETAFARSIKSARDRGHAFDGRLRTQARRRELDARVVQQITTT